MLVVRSKSGPYSLRPEFFERQARIRAAKDALDTYKRLRAFRPLEAKFYQVELASIVEKGLRSLGRKQDALPELNTFRRRWELKFPIPPSVCVPLEELMTSPWCWPVQIVRADQQSLTLVVYPAAGKEIVLAMIEGALYHFSPKRRIQPRPGESRIAAAVRARDTDADARVMVASRKRSVQRDVRVAPLPRELLKVTIAVPTNAQYVKAVVAKKLSRSAASWRSRKDYEAIFQVIDEKVDDPDPGKVRDRKRAFHSLVRNFGLPQ
jgi:hypothetical protein